MKYMLKENATKIINLLHNVDNLAKPLAEFVGLVAQKQDSSLANEILTDILKDIFHSDSSQESIGIKNIAKFV